MRSFQFMQLSLTFLHVLDYCCILYRNANILEATNSQRRDGIPINPPRELVFECMTPLVEEIIEYMYNAKNCAKLACGSNSFNSAKTL